MVIFHSYVNVYQRINLHFPKVFLRFSHFPKVFLGFSHFPTDFPMGFPEALWTTGLSAQALGPPPGLEEVLSSAHLQQHLAAAQASENHHVMIENFHRSYA